MNKKAFHSGFMGILEKQGYDKVDLYDMLEKQSDGWDFLSSPFRLGLNALKAIGNIGIAKAVPLSAGLGFGAGLIPAYAMSVNERLKRKRAQKNKEIDDLLKSQYAMQKYLAQQKEVKKEGLKLI